MSRKKQADKNHYLKNKNKIIKNSTEWNRKHREYHREYDRRWRKKYPHKRRGAYLKRAYKITLEEYELIKQIQEGRCAICLQKSSRLVIDHDHITGTLRGLLCTTCNAGIGQLKENIELLEKAIAYLKRHEASRSTKTDSP